MTIYICPKFSSIKEGGAARDVAISNILAEHCELAFLSKNRLWNVVKIFYYMLAKSNNSIIFRYPSIGVPLGFGIVRFLFCLILRFTQTKKRYIFDISDLPIEQSLDLELKIPHHYKTIERSIFNRRGFYIFASGSMRDYICSKYRIISSSTTVWINGANSLKVVGITGLSSAFINDCDKRLKFVYAGTLNRGRQIEIVIEVFRQLKMGKLILFGSGGDWLVNQNLPDNIFYLGSKEEEEAHYIVSLCDVGLIPYDESRFYYNIAYPTKLSFYISAGIPYLSTPVKEVLAVQDEYDFGYIGCIGDWRTIIEGIRQDDLIIKKNKVSNNQSRFLWSNIIKPDELELY